GVVAEVARRRGPAQPATNTRARSGSTAATAPTLPGKAVGFNERRNLAPARPESYERTATLAELGGLFLLDDAVDSVSPRRVEDAAVTDPEGDVVGSLRRAVRDQVSGAEIGLGQRLTCLLLLVGVPRHEAATGSERHVDETRAVDPGGGHPAPLVMRAEQRPRLI